MNVRGTIIYGLCKLIAANKDKASRQTTAAQGCCQLPACARIACQE